MVITRYTSTPASLDNSALVISTTKVRIYADTQYTTMGSAAGKLLGGNRNKIEFMESTKMPTAKDVDLRRRNSLMFFMRDWQELSTFEEQETSMLQV